MEQNDITIVMNNLTKQYCTYLLNYFGGLVPIRHPIVRYKLDLSSCVGILNSNLDWRVSIDTIVITSSPLLSEKEVDFI